VNRLLLSAGAGALLLAVALGSGYRLGVKNEQGRQAQALVDAMAEVERKEEAHRVATSAWLKERDKRLQLERQLNDEARQDPDADRPAVGPSSVRRIDSVH
jgi:hypothetical protein